MLRIGSGEVYLAGENFAVIWKRAKTGKSVVRLNQSELDAMLPNPILVDYITGTVLVKPICERLPCRKASR